MASKEVADLTLRVLDGTEEFHLVAGVVRDGGGAVTNHGNSRRTKLSDILAYISANIPASGISQAFADGRYLQKGNNLSDLGSAVTARGNLSVYSIAQVDAAIAAAGGNWWKGFVPTAATFPTTMKATATTSHIVMASDADVGLTLDSTDNGQAGGNFKIACHATPSDAADWTVTCRITALLTQGNNVNFGMALAELTGSSGAWPLVNVWGPGTFAGQFLDLIEALADFSYNSNRFQRGIINGSHVTWWLRIRWVVGTGLYMFDASIDGKQWLNIGSQSKAALLFNARATHIGLGFYMNGINALAGKNLASCDYWRVT